jgi:catalase
MDTQIKRVGPNFAQLPINRPTCPFSNNQRDGEGQQMIFKGKVAYFPNSLAHGAPTHSPESSSAFTSYAERIDATKIRQRSESFSDHFSQATLFWNSMADWEKEHLVAALSFELNMVETKAIKERIVNHLLVNVADELAKKVADNINVKITKKPTVKFHQKKSAALSMDKLVDAIKGRKVAILAGDGVSASQVKTMKAGLEAEGAIVDVIARGAGTIEASDGSEIPVAKPAANAASVMYDAVFLPDGGHVAATAKFGLAIHFVAEAYAHGKPIAAIGEAAAILTKAQVPFKPAKSDLSSQDGLIVAPAGSAGKVLLPAFIDAMKHHRFYKRPFDGVPA